MVFKLVAFSGSLRKGSRNSALVHSIAKIASESGLNISVTHIVDLNGLPLFSEDLENTQFGAFPKSVQTVRELVAAADGILLATPEYNSLPSAAIKNLVDWLSRGKPSAFATKKIAVVSAGGGMAGMQAQNALRTSFSNMQKYMGVPLTIIEPTVALNLFGGQAYFGKNAGETDTLVDEATIEGVKQILRAFLEEPTAA